MSASKFPRLPARPAIGIFRRNLGLVIFISNMLCVGCHSALESPHQRDKSGSEINSRASVVSNSSSSPNHLTIQVRLFSKGNTGDAYLIKLDAEKLQANHLSKDDVIEALTPSTLHGTPPDRQNGVVYVEQLQRLERYPEIVVKADSNGNIVRVKDIAKVELLPKAKVK